MYQSVASWGDVEEEEGMTDDDGGGGDDADKPHQVSVVSLMGVNERVEACELALVPFHRMWCKNVAKDHRDIVVYVLQLMAHLNKIWI